MTGESNQERMTTQRGGRGEDKQAFSYVSPPQIFCLTQSNAELFSSKTL